MRILRQDQRKLQCLVGLMASDMILRIGLMTKIYKYFRHLGWGFTLSLTPVLHIWNFVMLCLNFLTYQNRILLTPDLVLSLSHN